MSDSKPVPAGDPNRHLALEVLEARLQALPPAPKDEGRVVALFASPGTNQRIAHERAALTAAGGMQQDCWSEKRNPKANQQLATMQGPVAELLANGQGLSMFGDNLFLDLDLSTPNLPAGTRLRAGSALLEVTPEPHDGCRKFKARFGSSALRLVSHKQTRDRNLRGIYLKVIEDGEVAAGDPVRVIRT